MKKFSMVLLLLSLVFVFAFCSCEDVFSSNSGDSTTPAQTVVDGPLLFVLNDTGTYTVFLNRENEQEFFGEIVIPETVNGIAVTCIGEEAFKDPLNNDILKVVIPDSVTRIEDYAFWGCGLSEITLPKNLVHIGKMALFENSFDEIVLPKSVTSLGKPALNIDWYIYYEGSVEDFVKTFGKKEERLYYYSEVEPSLHSSGEHYDGNYWRYDENNKPTPWILEN